MFSWLPTDAEVSGTDDMPFDLENHSFPGLYAETTDQDMSGWKMASGTTLEEEIDPEMLLKFQPGGLTLPPMVGSTAWTTQKVAQTHQNETSRLAMSNQIQDNCSLFPQPSMFDDKLTPLPGRPIYPGTNSTSLSFSGHIEYQNEPKVATMESFFTSYDHGIPYHSTDIIEPNPSVEKSPPPTHSTASSTTQKTSIPQRKRGRGKKVRDLRPTNDDEKDSSLPLTTSFTPGNRVPHNQIEQKYRNGLNENINRLREVVASSQNTSDSAKLSKAMVLSGAVDCIKTMEDARDELEVENKGLRKRNSKLRRDKRRLSAAGSLGEDEVKEE